MREEIIGDARLILGDCRDVLPTLSDKFGPRQSQEAHRLRRKYHQKCRRIEEGASHV